MALTVDFVHSVLHEGILCYGERFTLDLVHP